MYDNDMKAYEKPQVKIVANIDIIAELCGGISTLLQTTSKLLL